MNLSIEKLYYYYIKHIIVHYLGLDVFLFFVLSPVVEVENALLHISSLAPRPG
jgi:hypothetical protein